MAEEVMKHWNAYIINKDPNKVPGLYHTQQYAFYRSAYNLGLYMVYSIIHVNHYTDFEKIFHWSPYKFVREYENAMKIIGIDPIVSIQNNKGIIVYQRLLAQWNVLLQSRSN